jgi:hypothetical protein
MTTFRISSFRLRKKAGTSLAVAAALIMAAAGVAAATSSAATIVRETITQGFSESGLSDDCRPGITGDLAGTEVFEYQSVETANGFHVQGTDGGPGQIDWSDGSYTLIESVDRFAFNLVGKGQTELLTLTHVDSGDTYAEDGTLLFRTTFHEVERFTFVNGVPRVEIQRGHFHSSGAC